MENGSNSSDSTQNSVRLSKLGLIQMIAETEQRHVHDRVYRAYPSSREPHQL
jgi:hypothetical protein